VKIDVKFLNRVLDAKSRSISETERANALKSRLEHLQAAWIELANLGLEEPSQKEFVRHFPVAFVSLLQGFYRLAIRDLIDCDKKYKLNCSKIVDAQYGLHAVVALEDQQVTVGEIVANAVSLSSPQSIYTNLNTITDGLFLKLVKEYPLKCPSCDAIHRPESMVPSMFQDIADLFSKRNILAHEIASEEAITREEVEQWFQSVGMLLMVSDNVIFRLCTEVRYPGLYEMIE